MDEQEQRRCLHSISRTDCVKCCERMVIAAAKAWLHSDGSVNASDRLVDTVEELERLEGEGMEYLCRNCGQTYGHNSVGGCLKDESGFHCDLERG